MKIKFEIEVTNETRNLLAEIHFKSLKGSKHAARGYAGCNCSLAASLRKMSKQLHKEFLAARNL